MPTATFIALPLSFALLAGGAAPDVPTGADDVAQVETAAVPDSVTPGVEHVVEQLQANYDAISDFQADFTQETYSLGLAETRTSTGRVYFLRPGRMVWDYGEERSLILDGTSLHSVDWQNGQYYSAPVASSDLPTAMRFLMGEGDLSADFEITLLEESTTDRAMLDLVPVQPSGNYARLRFVVDTGSWNVVETTILDELGNTNTIRFHDMRTNLGMDPAAFTFAPPEGLVRIEVPD